MPLPDSRRLVAFLCLYGLAGCHHESSKTRQDVRYVTGAAWQGRDGWFYPAEDFALKERGLAVIATKPASGVTADGEIWSARAMTGAHQTLQLPAVVSVRNLQNGRIVRIRLNDRGPGTAGRIIAISPHAAALLGMGEAPTPVEIVEDEALSRRIADSDPHAAKLEIATAPREAITAESLTDGHKEEIGGAPSREDARSQALLLPEMPATVQNGMAETVSYEILLGSFSGRSVAARVAARCDGAVTRGSEDGGRLPWRVTRGPFTTVAEADRALDQARPCGSTGARIVVR
ncbi:septal ring lytic transglycosylase RlpA family protein [Swaminathania salitolerans]|uniref:septal ring lytic transglycosylase RlpA family protein n=1 Tax=Swaminathania salitolerans TaxID=182838 RepID=UPI0011BF0083|nr:RlpA-like double-psi beta-barrel domain-containing protein [Swaminathania salitolerans]